MKPPFQYPRRAEADNFRTKVKLVRSAFRSPRSIAVGSHQPRRGPASLVNGFSSAATDHLNRFWSSEVPNHKQCHGPKSGFLCRLYGWGSRCASASKLQKMEDSTVIPRLLGQIRPPIRERLRAGEYLLSNGVTSLRGILSYLRQQQAPSKFGAAQTDIAPSSGTRPFGVMLSTTRRRCWLSCDRKWWARYRTGGTWSLHLILAENHLQLPCETA